MIGAIGFESDEVQLRKLRERLRLMSDQELIQFGKECRNLVRAKRVWLRLTRGPHNWKRRGRSGDGGIRRFEWMPEPPNVTLGGMFSGSSRCDSTVPSHKPESSVYCKGLGDLGVLACAGHISDVHLLTDSRSFSSRFSVAVHLFLGGAALIFIFRREPRLLRPLLLLAHPSSSVEHLDNRAVARSDRGADLAPQAILDRNFSLKRADTRDRPRARLVRTRD